MARKSIKLNGFKVQTAEVTTQRYNLISEIESAISTKTKLSDRFMSLNPSDEHSDVDLIADIKKTKEGLFGCFWRIKSGVASQISTSQINNASLSLNDIEQETKKNVVGTLKDYSFFYLTKDRLVYSNGNPRIKSFQTYINWILRESNQAFQYIFVPIISETKEVPLSSVSSIDVSDSFFKGNTKATSEYSQSFASITRAILKQLLSNQKTLGDLEEENIISAKILLTVKKGLKKDDDKRDALSALIKSTNGDDIIIRTKDGRKLQGSFFESKKQISVETTNGGHPSEPEIEGEMIQYVKELDDVEINS